MTSCAAEGAAAPSPAASPAESDDGFSFPSRARPAGGRKESIATTLSRRGEPPTSWSKEAKTYWAKLPLAVTAAVAKREAEIADGFKKYADLKIDADLGRRIREASAPIAKELAARNMGAADMVNEFLAIYQTFRGPNAAAMLEHLKQTFSIPVAILPLPPKSHP
jgi:hypothetical protein